MKLNLSSSFFVAIAIASGLIVLLGYFFDLPLFIGLREAFLQWAVILGAVLLIVGIVNLARVHWKKFSSNQPGGWYSVILLVSLGLTLLVALVGYWIGDGNILTWLFNYVQVPIERSLMAILAVILAYAAARMLKRRLNFFSIVFILTVLLVLIGSVSLPGIEIALLGNFRNWVVQVTATAGARGILLGVALGTIATGLRVIMGADRPYGG
jgi:hypothetical protein